MLSSYGLKFHLYFLDFLNFLLHQRVLHRGLYHVISWVLNKKNKNSKMFRHFLPPYQWNFLKAECLKGTVGDLLILEVNAPTYAKVLQIWYDNLCHWVKMPVLKVDVPFSFFGQFCNCEFFLAAFQLHLSMTSMWFVSCRWAWAFLSHLLNHQLGCLNVHCSMTLYTLLEYE